jgi:hypothetical protein
VSGRTAGYHLVQITSILTPTLKIKNVYIKGTQQFAMLGKIGVLPAEVMLPIEMTQEHKAVLKALATSPLATDDGY